MGEDNEFSELLHATVDLPDEVWRVLDRSLDVLVAETSPASRVEHIASILDALGGRPAQVIFDATISEANLGSFPSDVRSRIEDIRSRHVAVLTAMRRDLNLGLTNWRNLQIRELIESEEDGVSLIVRMEIHRVDGESLAIEGAPVSLWDLGFKILRRMSQASEPYRVVTAHQRKEWMHMLDSVMAVLVTEENEVAD